MPIPINAVWELQSGGSATNGAIFIRGSSGTDYSQQNSPQISRTDVVIDAVDNTKGTSAGTPFTTDEIGNGVYIPSGTGFTVQRTWITAVDGGNIATFDDALGTVASTGGVMDMGGAYSAGSDVTDAFWEAMPDGNHLYLKDDDIDHVWAGNNVGNDGGSKDPVIIEGYRTTRGDGLDNPGNRPTIDFDTQALLFDNFWRFYYLDITGSNATMIRADAGARWFQCSIINTSGSAGRVCVRNVGDARFVQCDFKSEFGYGVRDDSQGRYYYCRFYDSEDYGIRALNFIGHVENCTFDNIAGVAIFFEDEDKVVKNCTFNDCGVAIQCGTSGHNHYFTQNMFTDCTTGILYDVATDRSAIITHNNFFGCTTDITAGLYDVRDSVSIDPNYVDADNGDFTPQVDLTFEIPIGMTGGTTATGYYGAVNPAFAVAKTANLLGGKL